MRRLFYDNKTKETCYDVHNEVFAHLFSKITIKKPEIFQTIIEPKLEWKKSFQHSKKQN